MNWTLLHKYLSGECSPQEMREVKEWLRADDKNEQFMNSLQEIWAVEPEDEIEIDAKAEWDSFRHKLNTGDGASNMRSIYHKKGPKTSDSKSVKKYTRFVAAFLSAAAVILIAVFLYNVILPAGSGTDDSSVEQTKMQQVSTERGQRAKFRLADGSLVQLNADSKITIARNFGDSTRSVYLQGEAYFQVTHNPGVPFIVHAENAYTKVLGTKFGVKAYPQDNHIQVSVEEGKVVLGSSAVNSKKGKYITKNEVGLYSKSGKVTVSKITEIEQYLGWKDGRLTFRGTPFREVKPELERWYDIHIVVNDTSSLNPQELTASFKDEPVTEVINALSLSLNLKYKRKGRLITFYSN